MAREPFQGEGKLEAEPTVTIARPGRLRRRIRRVLRISLTVVLIVLLVGWWRVLRIVEHDHWPLPPDAVTAAQAQETTETFVREDKGRRDDVDIAYATTTASAVAIYPGGAQFLPAIVSDLESAQHSIHIMMFAFTEGTWGNRIADVLMAKVASGVEVRLSVDRYGSEVYSTSSGLYTRMTEAGIEIVVNDIFPLQGDGMLPDPSKTWRQDEVGRADHRKLMVIDGVRAWVGGGGFEDSFYEDRFHDVFIQVKGDIVRQMQAVFLTSFSAYGGALPMESGALAGYFPAQVDPGTIPVTLLQNLPGGFVPGTQASRAVIEESITTLDVMNPYLTDPGIIDRIVDAAKRGVRVRVVVPGTTNNWQAADALSHEYDRLLDAGVEIWEYPKVMHAKVTVADDTVIAGTINYDAWALYRNLEVALMFEDAAVAADVRRVLVEPDILASTPGEPPDGFADRVRSWFWDKFTYFL
jgi:cardiolipin synthase